MLFYVINLNCVIFNLKHLNNELIFIPNSIDKCSSIKCLNGGTCIIKSGKAVCNCVGRFGGEFCELGKSNNAFV